MTVTATYSVNTLSEIQVGTITELPDSAALTGGGWVTVVHEFDKGLMTAFIFNPDGSLVTNASLGDGTGAVATSPSGSLDFHAVASFLDGGGEGLDVGLTETRSGGAISYQLDTDDVSVLNEGTAFDIAVEQNPIFADPRNVVAWQEDFGGDSGEDIGFQIRNADTSTITSTLVSNSSFDDEAPSVAFGTSGTIVVAWTRLLPGGGTQVWRAVYDRDGHPSALTGQFAIDGSGSVNGDSSVAAGDDGFLIAYQHGSDSGDLDIGVAHLNQDGVLTRMDMASTMPGVDEQPAVAWLDGVYGVAFTHTFLDGGVVRDQDLYLSLFDADGNPLTAPAHPIAIDIDGVRITGEPSLTALDGGKILVSFFDQFSGAVSDRIIQLTETITGDDDANTLISRSNGVSTIGGGGGDDTIHATAAVNHLSGGTGNDHFEVGAGVTDIDGGSGSDTVTFLNTSGGPAVISLATSDPQTLGQGSIALTGVENLVGTNIADTLVGNSGANVLDGGGTIFGGADQLIGAGGNDTYVASSSSTIVVETAAGDGVDLVESAFNFVLPNFVENLTLTGLADIDGTGNSLANVLTGNAGDNVLTGGAGNDTYVVGAGDTVVEADGGGIDTVRSSASFTLGDFVENLTLTGSADLTATGNALANVLTGNAGNDTLRGGAGNDTYVVNNAGDHVVEAAGGGTDTIKASFSFSLASLPEVEYLVLAGTGDINGTGNALANALIGNAGKNVLDGGAGADTMTGGAGNDTFVVDNAFDRVIEATGGGTDTVKASVSYSLAGTEVEYLVLTGTGDINGTGNALANALIGNAGKNVLDGGSGADTMTGGAGNDTFVVDNASDRVIEAAGGGTDTVKASVSYSLAGTEAEYLVLTGTANINGTGNALANALIGNAGGNLLDGGSGADTMTGGAGNDTFIVDNASDRVIEAAGGGTDTVKASVSYSLAGGQVENAVLTGTGDTDATGNAFANRLTGNAGGNALAGGAGNDILNGGAGRDVMRGGAGNDTYAVDNAGDRIVEAKKGGTDTVKAAVSFSLAGEQVENLVLTGHGNTHGTGNAFANALTGNAGKNVLDGGAGADLLSGGHGSDTFVFSTRLGATNVDHIADFAAGAAAHDTIRLAHSVFHALPTGALAASAFKDLAVKAEDANDRILYNHKTGVLSYDDDGAGGDAAVKIAILNNHADLTHADFLIA